MPQEAPTVPSLGAEGAIEAPIIFFDEAPVFGLSSTGMPSVLLCTYIHDIGPDGKGTRRRKVVAQLRGSVGAFADLLKGLQQIEAILTKPSTAPN